MVEVVVVMVAGVVVVVDDGGGGIAPAVAPAPAAPTAGLFLVSTSIISYFAPLFSPCFHGFSGGVH